MRLISSEQPFDSEESKGSSHSSQHREESDGGMLLLLCAVWSATVLLCSDYR